MGEDRRSSDDDGTNPKKLVIVNPSSGSADHLDRVRQAAGDRGYEVRETEAGGDALAFAKEAGEGGTEVVAAAGGDGTVNQVVRGLLAADALPETRVGVIPAGTGNNFAGNLGIRGIDHGFEVLTGGEERRLDLGLAEERPFVNSCVVGLTANASAETSADLKASIGVLAYVLETLSQAREFDGLELTVKRAADGGAAWEGKAAVLLIGNARRFPAGGGTQANVEDGLLDVTIIEQRPTVEVVGAAAVERILGDRAQHITRLTAPALEVSVAGGDPVTISLDGELEEADSLSVRTLSHAMRINVGEDYRPDPDAG